MAAADSGNLDCLDHLIAKGANLNTQNNVRRRPCCGPRRPWRLRLLFGARAALPRAGMASRTC